MKLTFIGTSHGVPEAEHRCSCNMLTVGENVYFVDMGTQAIEDLRRMDIAPERVKGVFITHMHGDHVNGLLSFVDICNWFFTSADPGIFLPTREGAAAVKNWILALDKRDVCRIEPCVTEEGVIFDDGTLSVTAVRTQHTRRSFAYFIRAEGKTLLFTSDLKGAEVDFPAVPEGTTLDAVICESAHVPPMDYVPVFEKLRIKRAFVTHVQPRKAEQARELMSALEGKIPVFIPRDGDEYEL
ncbi:MAG: ribonuclease Z [Clostridia bacterium]|nr:ribonuclease Z [Clostridia bacterium]